MNEKEFYLFVHGDTFEVMIHLKQFSWSKKVLAIRLKGFGVFTQIEDRILDLMHELDRFLPFHARQNI